MFPFVPRNKPDVRSQLTLHKTDDRMLSQFVALGLVWKSAEITVLPCSIEVELLYYQVL